MKSFLACVGGLGMAVGLLLGCGGKVVVDQGGGVAGGGAGAGGGSTVVDPESLCSAACDAEAKLGCPKELGAGDCVASCMTSFQTLPTCTAELGATLACGTAAILATSNCNAPGDCQNEANALVACVQKATGP
jgi:hypothetical protein